ncbi:hypothetical protein J5N97_002800 [Dioscorea zingiberensis]|uniref:Uncharacterized protein n=1 Tax=Dioscorea zingiberensis TaxID=325984 RepID=A0A9D5D4K7_9LILI|nr:hypothetical protein J5N97_002800 [Dioscorea zingiberensis]
MAAPHLAGVVALIKSIHKNWSPAAIKSAIMTTADRLDLDSKPITDDYDRTREPAGLFAIGAGQVNPQATIDPGLIYNIMTSNYIQYLCGLGYSDKNVSVIVDRQIKCADIDNISAEDLNYPSITVTLDPNVTKTVTRQLTNVVISGAEVYNAVVEEPKGASVVVTPNKLGFGGLGMKKKFTVEFKITDGSMSKDQESEGQLLWRSPKHEVRSPVSVTFA